MLPKVLLFALVLSFTFVTGQTPSADRRIVLPDLLVALSDPGIAEVSELRDAINATESNSIWGMRRWAGFWMLGEPGSATPRKWRR